MIDRRPRSFRSHPRADRFALAAGVLAGVAIWAVPESAEACCGFYVARADANSKAKLYNDATTVVLMRDGARTVLSIQPSYLGPPEDFAIVIPVPAAVDEDDVKVLSSELFDRVDRLTAPRLVEYWERDPCAPPPVVVSTGEPRADGAVERDLVEASGGDRRGVSVEAQFDVDEYQVAVLSAQESKDLEIWLNSEGYRVPQGSTWNLKPYIKGGSRFVVAKVDVDKVEFTEQGRVKLSPLRVHYDEQALTLPVRVGLINARGAQDLVIHVLARNTRYAVSNYKNVTIPTNLEVEGKVWHRFGTFYASLFDHVISHHPQAVVTEYSWAVTRCDTCPEPPLTVQELQALGADVLAVFAEPANAESNQPGFKEQIASEFVLTRLHARYDARLLGGGLSGEDLVFEPAPAIVGGRELVHEDGTLERRAVVDGAVNNFQARYTIRHRWLGPVECEDPQYGSWGVPWPELGGEGGEPKLARNLAFVPRGATLAGLAAESGADQIAAQVAALPRGQVPSPVTIVPDVPKQSKQQRSADHVEAAFEYIGCSVNERATEGGGVAFGLMVLAAGYRRRQRSVSS